MKVNKDKKSFPALMGGQKEPKTREQASPVAKTVEKPRFGMLELPGIACNCRLLQAGGGPRGWFQERISLDGLADHHALKYCQPSLVIRPLCA
jgi:hypothetical protein